MKTLFSCKKKAVHQISTLDLPKIAFGLATERGLRICAEMARHTPSLGEGRFLKILCLLANKLCFGIDNRPTLFKIR